MFQSPGADEFAHAQGRLETRIAERTSSAVRDLYEVHFSNVPEEIIYSLQFPLVPSSMEMWLFGGKTAIPAIIGIIETVVARVINAIPGSQNTVPPGASHCCCF